MILACRNASQGCKRLYSLGAYLPLCGDPVKTAVEQKPWNMNSIAGWVGAIGLTAVVAIYPQKSAAEKFTGAEFLAWSVEGQDSYNGTSITMATLVAGRTNPARATCLDEWYATSETLAAQRDAEIRDTIRRNAEYHPSAVIVLVLEEACGHFGAE